MKFPHRKYQRVVWVINGVLALVLVALEVLRRTQS